MSAEPASVAGAVTVTEAKRDLSRMDGVLLDPSFHRIVELGSIATVCIGGVVRVITTPID